MSIPLAFVIGYLIGGLPTGIIVCRVVKGVDPRTVGSGSSGATNVSRILGKKWAIVVLLIDALKGYLPVLLIPQLVPVLHPEAVSLALAAGTVTGHIWTPYAGFRGGKGVGTAAGAMLALDPLAVGIALAVWLLLYVTTRIVSLSSILAAVTLPLAMLFLPHRPPLYIAATSVLAILIVFTHRSNIARLVRGCEKPTR